MIIRNGTHESNRADMILNVFHSRITESINDSHVVLSLMYWGGTAALQASSVSAEKLFKVAEPCNVVSRAILLISDRVRSASSNIRATCVK